MYKRAKSTMKTGVATMTGNLVIGNIAGVKGMPASGVASMGTISAGMNMANIGELSKTGMSMTEMLGKKKSYKKRKR